MATVEYICLACGNHFTAAACTSSNKDEQQCPQCRSTTIYKLNPQNLFGFFSGGG
ncbi:MAG: zinc ribbon domain-containing protein [Nitrospirota bacterium]